MRKTFQGYHPDDQLHILETGSELVMEKTYPANQSWKNNGILHLHPHQDETFEVIEGILSVRVGEEERTYVSGEKFQIKRGTPHLMCNLSRKIVRIRWEVRPAMNTEDFFETMYTLQREGKMGNLLQQAVIAWAYRDIFRPLSPPLWIQPLILAPLALIGRWLGYRARRPL